MYIIFVRNRPSRLKGEQSNEFSKSEFVKALNDNDIYVFNASHNKGWIWLLNYNIFYSVFYISKRQESFDLNSIKCDFKKL